MSALDVLRRQAEAEMRRPAPESLRNKRQKTAGRAHGTSIGLVKYVCVSHYIHALLRSSACMQQQPDFINVPTMFHVAIRR